MPFKDARIQRKLMAVILVTTSVALIVSCLGFISFEIYTVRKNMARSLEARAEIIAASLSSQLALQNRTDAIAVLDTLKSDPRMVSACVYDGSGGIFARFPANAPDTLFPASPGQPGHQFGTSFLSTFSPVIKDGRTIGTVYLKSNLSALTDRYPGYAGLTLSIFAGSLLVAGLLSKFLGRQISGPIQSLAETARAISSRRDFSVRAVKYSDDELGLLTDALNQMLAQIQEQNLDLLQFAAIFKSTDDAIIGRGLDGIINSWNHAAEKTFGYTAQEAIGKSILAIIPPDRIQEEADILARIVRGESIEHFDTVRVRKDGKRIDVSVTVSPIVDNDGRINGASKIARDITVRKQAEEARRASEARYRTLFENAPDGIVIADSQSYYLDANVSICRMLGYTHDKLVGLHASDIVVQSEIQHIEPALSEIKAGSDYHREWQFRRKDGSTFAAEVIATTMPDGNLMGMIRDITGRKAAEEKIHRLNAELEQRVIERTGQLEAANKELEAFSYSVSHDLRAPLRAVNGFASIVLNDFGPQLPDEGKRYLERVCSGARRMGELIDDLLAFSHLSRQPVNRHTIDTNLLVQTVLDELKPQRDGRHIEFQIGKLAACPGDPALLRQVWVNLLSNAIKYSRDRDPALIEVGCAHENGENVYFVRDNGVGFDMQYAAKLFGVFQRLHRADEFEGTGVGLAIVQRIVHRHGGRIWADAKLNQGSTFYFTIGQENKP